MLSWLSKLCVWWCIIHRLKEYIPPIYTRDNGFESIAELLNVLCHGNLRVMATKEIPPSTEVVMDDHIQRSCFHASGTCATRESPAFQCFLKVFLISFAGMFSLCTLFDMFYKKSPTLESFVSSAHLVSEVSIRTASLHMTYMCFMRKEFCAPCAPQTKRREL